MLGFLMMLVLIASALALYFLPTGVAHARAHSKIASIFVLNLFLGWTFLFWIAALVWAVSENNVVTGEKV
jgi:hypothetical protein